MFSTADTIVAIATPPGRGALGIVRLSGPDAPTIAAALTGRREPFPPRRASFSRLHLNAGSGLGDEVVITFYPAPNSATGDDVVEISAHGSPVVLAEILRSAVERGARLAEPGEFSFRGFLNGKRDLVQTEAVADLIAAVTPLQARAAFDQLQGTLTTEIGAIESELFDLSARLEASLDFPDEGYHFVTAGALTGALERIIDRVNVLLASAARGRLIRDGAVVSIVGTPNVGKSSLFNALLNAKRAIVTAVPGTTRDLLTEQVDLGGLALSLVDTAGIRSSGDEIEQEGVRRARAALDVTELALVVFDRSRPLGADDRHLLDATAGLRRLLVINKIDQPEAWRPEALAGEEDEHVCISIHSGAGLEALVASMTQLLGSGEPRAETPLVTNLRHIKLLTSSREALTRGRDALAAAGGALPEEFLLADLQEALERLQEVTGRRTSEDLLRHIFARFCIGK